MKAKYKWFLLATTFGSIALGASVFVLGNSNVLFNGNKNDQTNPPPTTVVPAFKNNISFMGSLSSIIKTDGRKQDVDSNLKTIFNNNKKSLLSNANDLKDEVINSLNIEPQISGWDNWGAQTFEEWKTSNSSATTIEYSNNTKIEFDSKNQLKQYLNENLKNMISNATSASIDNADFGIDDNGNLLIPVTYTTTQVQTNKNIVLNNSLQSLVDQKSTTKSVLKIAPEKISFNPNISLSGTYGSNQTIKEQNVTLNCSITVISETDVTFDSAVSSKNTITLEEKENTQGTIGLWDTVTDVGILKSLGWIDSDSALKDHVDGNGIDASLLNEDKIISDLKIAGLTTNTLLGIGIEMNQRDVNAENYNGEYSILVSALGESSPSFDLNLNLKTYRIVSQKGIAKSNVTPLQVNVPNAYILDTNNGSERFYRLTTINSNGSDFIKLTRNPFEIGRKDVNPTNNITFLQQNFSSSNTNTTKAFIKEIVESQKSNKDVLVFNGIDITNVTFETINSVINDVSKINLNFSIKKGFSLKKEFGYNTYKFNTNTTISSNKMVFECSVGWEQEQSQWHLFYANPNKTPSQINNGLTSK